MARDTAQPPGATPADLLEMTHGRLTLERYGELSAHLRRFPRSARAEVLARLKIADADWEAAVCGWTDALAEESADGGEALSNRFCQAFAAAEARLKREQPTLASLGPLPAEAPPEVSPRTPPAPGAVPAGMRHFTSLRETVEASPPTSHGPALPFAPRAPAGPRDVPRAPAGPRDVPRAPAGPRDTKDRSPSFAESERAPTPPARSAFPPGGHTADVSTAVASALGQRNPLPFNATPKGAALPADVRPGTARAVASQPVSTASAAVLSLEQHASMCAEIAVAPGKIGEILARYGLTEATRAQADEHWRARIAQEARAWEAWQRAYTLHRDRLLGLRS
ncbi:hypothetical protein [Sorangium sp. So ce1389]|uniref:hypothetical protein n=1 Tax=Sorangium sp. So ce1389 TaxID=3133336 RepID=UPI003F64030E